MKIFKDRFYWNVAAAACGTGLACCYIHQGDNTLGILWAICALCNIYFAWASKRED